MIDGRKNSLKYSCALLFSVFLLLLTFNSQANYSTGSGICKSLTPFQDTTKPGAKSTDTIPRKNDSLVTKTDSFNLKLSKDSLDSPISYSASDSMVLDVPTKKITLFSKANVKNKDMDLSSDSIEFDQEKHIITATYRRDSTGRMIGRPKMIQGESTMESDLMQFDTKTQKGITRNTFTQQGEIYVMGERMKKISTNEFYALRGQFTTCNLDTPHFAFRAKKMKFISQKLAVSGPIHPEFEGVPVPLYLPFGFFPISQGRHSGILAPQFTASEQFGIGLEGLGYYKVISDYLDVTLRSNIYSYGGWAVFVSPTYRKRYRYNGGLNFSLQKTRLLSSDPKEEFTKSQTFNITWSHTVDSRARPGTSFSANVNAGSTKYNQYVVNNPMRNYSNQLSSSITYAKQWESSNLTVSANHNQNNNTGVVNVNLPTIAYTLNTFYPFQKKEIVGEPKWYEKLGIGLNSNIGNQISFYDSAFSFRRVLDTIQWGALHNIPIQLSLPPLGPIQISPGVAYQEKWYSSRLVRSWNAAKGKVDTTINKGFYRAGDMSFSISMSTALFGTFDKFGERSAIRAIRHVIRPTVSLNYKPDFAAKDYYRIQIDSANNTFRFSYYDGTLFGPFSEGTFGGLSFGLDNNIEMKVRSKKDTANGGIKKIRLIDGFGINGGYNFIADSFKLSQLSLYLRSTLFEKINITMGASVDPYQVDTFGFKKDKYMWQGGDKFSLGRVVNGNIAISTTFQSKRKDEAKAPADEQSNPNRPPITLEEQMAELDYVRQNPAEFADFNVPWSLNLSYSLSFFRDFRSDYKGFETKTNSSFNWNGDFNLTEKWKMGMNGFYDFATSSIQQLTMYITREMHCWQLSINVTPIGLYRSFNITINPKSGLLRDLRVNRTRYFYGN
jgi:LPS-assembly protein